MYRTYAQAGLPALVLKTRPIAKNSLRPDGGKLTQLMPEASGYV